MLPQLSDFKRYQVEPVWEWKWAFWDETRGGMEVTPVWMTEDEARSDWYAYDDPRSHRLEHTRRDRCSHKGELVDAPARDVDWTPERRRRAERSRYGLPPFTTPLYSELRRIWTQQSHPDVRRLALEVQTARYALAELEAMAAEAYWYISRDKATVEDAARSLARIRRRLMQEMQRIGPVTRDRG